ncbi:ERF family protein, partial [Borreliella garinii]|uniref:ERF family protein n=1 Tax=Borreliella garinii TaxID=29519 RepID=UPI0035940D15
MLSSTITYVKRYALVSFLMIESEVDTNAEPIYNNYENGNSVPRKQVSVNQHQKKEIKQEQRKDNNKQQRKDRFYYYSIF